MSNGIFKNYQINMGMPFQIKSPLNFDTIKKFDSLEDSFDDALGSSYEFIEEDLINNAKEEASLIIKEAELEASRLFKEAEEEITKISLVTEEEAKTRGFEEGFALATAQYDDLIQEAQFLREQAKTEYKQVLAGIEANVVEVILDIAKKVIGAEISFNKEDVLYLIKQAFEKCANKDNIILKLSLEDYEYVVANKDRLLSMVEGLGAVDIKKDGSLKVGSCIVETQFGSIDAGVHTKLQKIEEAFRQVIGK